MSAAPAKKTKKTTASAKKKASPAKPAAKKSPAKKEIAAPAKATAAPATGPVEVCPSCGTATFGPEERTRWEGRRTVRFTVLVCERGHTFAHPVIRPA